MIVTPTQATDPIYVVVTFSRTFTPEGCGSAGSWTVSVGNNIAFDAASPAEFGPLPPGPVAVTATWEGDDGVICEASTFYTVPD